ncbi:MAG: c-type cytochrome biogenesis protein CcsB [Deltaproteobacteria bacterium]
MNLILFKVILGLYCAASISYLVYLAKPASFTGRLSHWLTATGFILHCAFTLFRYHEAGYTPITNMHESFSFFGLAIVGIFIAFERRYRVVILGAFVLPVALLLLIASFSFPSAILPLLPVLKSRWLLVHTTFAFSGYAAFTLAFCAAVMYLIQEHYLKYKKLGALYHKLPPLDTLDDINYHCLTIGFPLFTVAIITGAIWAETAWGSYWSWDPKETWSLITWFLYAALLHGRLTTGWRGRRAAILAIAGFIVLLFTFLGVNFFLPGLHSYK